MGKSKVAFEVRTQGDVHVVDISGQLDSFSARDARAELEKLTDARHYNLLLNLEKVAYVSSAAIGAIVAVAKQVRKRNGDLRIFGPKAEVRKVLDLVGASKILEIFDTEQEAVRSFS